MNKLFLNIETIEEYNKDAPHPLVSVINLDESRPMRQDEKSCELIYGRQKYDYSEGSVVCLTTKNFTRFSRPVSADFKSADICPVFC